MEVRNAIVLSLWVRTIRSVEDLCFRTIDARYGRISFFANDVGAASQSLATYGEWAENEIGFVKGFISSGGTVVDVGAYIGTHTLAFSRFVGPEGVVVSLEAQTETFDLLKHNVAVNQISNVQLENAAVCDRIGELTIPLIDMSDKASFGSASLREVLTNQAGRPDEVPGPGTQRMAKVRSVAIDGFALPHCTLIKIDTEGAEDMVIRGAADTIRRTSPVVYAECNSVADGLRSFELLRDYGYEVRLHLVDAFNKDNFLGVSENVFGVAREAALVGLRAEDTHRFDAIALRPCELLLRIETADDLALGMLNKPQYPDEVLRLNAAARSGGDSWLKEIHSLRTEFERALNEATWAKGCVAEERARSAELAVQVADANARAHALQNAVSLAQEEHRRALTEKEDALAMAEACLRQATIAREISDRARASMEASRKVAAELEGQLTALSKEVAHLNSTLTAVYASRSWRLTAPLRAVHGLAKGRLS